MTAHTIIEIGSPLWWKMLTGTIIVIAASIILGYKIKSLKDKIATAGGIILIALAVLIHPYLIYLGQWNLQSSLPLNLCSLSGILSGVVLLKRDQLPYEFLLFWGLPAAFHALLTPEMTLGSHGLFLYEYYISHGGIIFAGLYLSILYNMRPRKNSWLKIFLYTQLLIPFVGFVDWVLNANYMYLWKKPLAHNPLIIGEWPVYIFVLEIAVLLHFYLVYLPFRLFAEKENLALAS